MPAFFSYLFKLSLSLSVVFLFYQLVLRRLTFYSWNRFYLLCYTMLSFFIPFINLTPVLEKNEMLNNRIVLFIPSVGGVSSNNFIRSSPEIQSSTFVSSSDVLAVLILAGMMIMLFRLFIQFLSFRKMMKQSELIRGAQVKFYQVNKAIIPFSFGNSIFINRDLHSEDELKEIVRHEFIHVRQKHTIDIIWAEILCILNWYNPVIWIIRKAIRQNLEFIADNKVLQSGIDRKQYQYLLLKVTGNNHFSITSQFNFSSLKKRIAMMNKMKSAGVHVVKFLFVLPLIAVLLLAFRNENSRLHDKLVKSSVSLKGNVDLLSHDTAPVNSKGYFLDIRNENYKDIVIVKDHYQNMVKEIPLVLWKKRKDYYENVYGKGVDEVIEHAVKESMRLPDDNKKDEWKPGKEVYMRERVNDAKVLHVITDTLEWLTKEKKFFFKGKIKTVANDIINDMRFESTDLVLDWPKSYVLINGNELDMNKNYISYSETSYWIISLSKEEAIRKYGVKGKNGAVEIISKNL